MLEKGTRTSGRVKVGLLFHMRYKGKLKTVISSKLRPETMKLPEENKTETLQNIGAGKDFFLFKTPKAQETKAKIENEVH